jgi:hypothetical protein
MRKKGREESAARTGRVVTDRSEEVERGVGELECNVLPVVVKALLNLGNADRNDSTDVLPRESVIDDDAVNPVDKLNRQGGTEGALDEVLGRVGDDVGVVGELIEEGGTNVGGHDDNLQRVKREVGEIVSFEE